MRNIFVVQTIKRFRGNWSELKQANMVLHLLATHDVVADMTEEQKGMFDGITEKDHLSFDVIHDCAKDKAKSCSGEDTFEIFTNEEHVLVDCGRARTALGLTGDKEDVLILFRDKTLMKEHLYRDETFRRYLPKFQKFDPVLFEKDRDKYLDELLANIPLPLFVKPTNLAGARKTAILETRDALHVWACEHVGDEQRYEFNEFISDSTLYHIDSAVQDGRIIFCAIGRDIHPCHEYLLGKSNGTIHVPRSEPEYRMLSEVNFKILNLERYPRLPNGIYHLELYLHDRTGEIKFVEIAARPAGAKIPHMYQYLYGVDLMTLHYALQLQLHPSINCDHGTKNFAWLTYPLVRDDGLEPARLPALSSAVETYELLQKPGFPSSAVVTSIHDTAALLMLANEDYSVLKREFDMMGSFQPLVSIAGASMAAVGLSKPGGFFLTRPVPEDRGCSKVTCGM